tara:strand:- start:1881 stop:3194 length:1314 start_codon:yes stop_codon:yes gene_type:complete
MSDLDKTIEELEAEVKSELEEMKDPKKGAAKGDAMGKKPEGEVQDLGPAVVKPDEKDSGPSKADDKIKKSAEPKAKATKMEDTESEDHQDQLDEIEDKKKKELGAEKKMKMDAEKDMEKDKSEEHKMKKEMSKMEMIKAMKDKMAEMGMKDEMSKQMIKAMKDKMAEMDMEKDDEDDMKKEDIDQSVIDNYLSSVDVSDDVNALTSNEDLSEEFKNKAKTVFEAAIKSKLRSEIVRIEQQRIDSVNEEVENVKNELTEKVDAYMNYVVEEWMKENEIALERGLKGEISEDFISGLKTLFEEHYIDVPDEKYDILGQQAEKIDELEKKLNEQIEKNASMKSDNSKLVRESVFSQACSDLTDTEAEKFKGLVEDVEFTDEDSFKEKLDTLKESYFPKAKTVAESVDSETNTGSESYETGAMAAYMDAISRNVPAKAVEK